MIVTTRLLIARVNQSVTLKVGAQNIDRYCVHVKSFFNIHSSSACTGLSDTNMIADKSFPIEYGVIVYVSCETGYDLEGSSTVTCEEGNSYKYDNPPACIDNLGK